MREDEKAGLRRLPLFSEMMPQTFDALMRVAYSQEFPPRLELFRQGRMADFLHVVVEGLVELHAEWQGQHTIMGVVRPVSAFILAACVCDVPYLMSARTVMPSRIVLIPAGDLRMAMRRDPDLAMAAMTEMADSYRVMVRHAKTLKLRNARQRLAAWVLNQAAGGRGFVMPVEKQHLASYLGITPESLSRTFRVLQDHGVMTDGAHVILTDPAALREVAHPDPQMDTPADGRLV